MSFDEQPAEGSKWDIHYHDHSTEHKVRVIAHCKHCARCRFERKNADCVVLAVAPVADDQPDGDIHGECAAEIHRLEQWQNEAAALLATFIGLSSRPDELEWSKVAIKVPALLAEEEAYKADAESQLDRAEAKDQLDACRPYLKEGETVADALARLSRLVNAVDCTDFYGIKCENIDGKNWFDVRGKTKETT